MRSGSLMENYLLVAEGAVVALQHLSLLQMVALVEEETVEALTILVKQLPAKKIQVEAAVAFSTMRQIFLAILVLVALVLSSSVLHKEV